MHGADHKQQTTHSSPQAADHTQQTTCGRPHAASNTQQPTCGTPHTTIACTHIQLMLTNGQNCDQKCSNMYLSVVLTTVRTFPKLLCLLQVYSPCVEPTASSKLHTGGTRQGKMVPVHAWSLHTWLLWLVYTYCQVLVLGCMFTC